MLQERHIIEMLQVLPPLPRRDFRPHPLNPSRRFSHALPTARISGASVLREARLVLALDPLATHECRKGARRLPGPPPGRGDPGHTHPLPPPLTAWPSPHPVHLCLCVLQISRLTWADGMRAVLKLESVPWLRLLPRLVEVEPDGNINYGRFLDRYVGWRRRGEVPTSSAQPDGAHHTLPSPLACRALSALCWTRYKVVHVGEPLWLDEVIERVSLRLFRSCNNLEQAYKLFDINGDGKIEYEVRHQTPRPACTVPVCGGNGTPTLPASRPPAHPLHPPYLAGVRVHPQEPGPWANRDPDL